MPLKKPSQLFNSEVVEEELSSPVKKYLNETYQQFQGTLSNIENLQEKIDQIYTEYPKTFELLAEEVSNRVTKSDLDNVMYSQLEVVDRSFKEIQEKVKGVNRKDLRDFKDNVSQLTEIVNNLIETELPQYKNRVTKTEVKLSDKFQSTENKVTDEINKFSTFLEEKIGEFDNDLEQTKEDVLNTNETFNKLRTIVKDEHLENNQKLEKFSETLNEFNSEANNFRDSLSDSLENDIDDFKKELKSLVSTDFIILEKHVKDDNEKLEEKINTYIEDNQKELVKLKDNVIDDVSDIFKGDIAENVKKLENKIKNIQEQYDNIKPEEIIQEGLLNIQSNEKNSDPLTPLDQNFVTTKQLQDHYRIFLNRVQEQLSTLGGGGETRLEFLDDVDRDTALINGKVLQYDSATKKWKGASAAGIGTEDSLVTSGIITAGNVTIGGITTALVVNGDAAITGILTVGESTLTLDGDNNIVQVGTALTLGHTNGIQFHTQNLHASGFEVNQINASGITTVNQLNVSGDGYESSIITESNYFSIKDSTNTSALFTPTGSAQLNYNNQTKIQTTNTGASITGKIEATDAEFTGNVSIAGTLTYEDVTNIDSVGLITARNGINIPTNKTIGLGDTISATIEYNSYGVMNRLNKHGASDFTWKLEDEDGTMHMEVRSGTTNSYVKLKQNNNTKFETKDYGVEITGTTDTDQLNVSGITTFGGNATFSADGTFTTSSGFTIENAQPGISFVDTGANPDFIIQNRDGSFAIRDTTSNANRFLVNMANGDVTVTGGLDVDGHTELDNVNVSGISTFVGDMNVANGSGIIEDAGGQLKIRANTFNFRDIGNTRQMLFVSQLGGAKLYHNGNQKFETLGFGATVYGTTQTQQLNVSGVSTFSKAVGISSNLNVTDNLNVAGITNLDNVSITGVSTFTGNIDLNADLDVDGHTELDDVNVSGVTSITAGAFASNVTAGGRTVATNIDIQSVSARTGIVVRNVYNYRTDSSPFGGFQVWDPYDSAATSYAFIAAAGATLVDKAWIKTDGTAYFAENVGIGITNPDAYQSSSRNLVIGKASDAAGITIRTGTSNGGYIRFADGTSGNQAYRGTIAYVHDGDYMMFATDSTEKVRITSGGDVGIGTTNPQAKLDVNGSVNVAGIVTSNMIHLTGGTYSSSDTKTDVGIVMRDDQKIYVVEGGYLRNLIGHNTSDNSIQIGQFNTGIIDDIHLKPGSNGHIILHDGTTSSSNIKLQTTGYGVSVTGLEVVGVSTFSDDIKIGDTAKLGEKGGNGTYVQFNKSGSGGYVQLYGDTTTKSLLTNSNGVIILNDLTVDGNTTLGDTSSDTLTVNAGTTFSSNISVSGVSTFTGEIHGDGARLGSLSSSGRFSGLFLNDGSSYYGSNKLFTSSGNGFGLDAYAGNDSWLKANTGGGTSGDCWIKTGSSSGGYLIAKGADGVELHHAGTSDKKLETVSDGAKVTGALEVTGNVSVGGTLTYEDVTNIDSVGLITARTGIKVLAGGINVSGVSTFNVGSATTAFNIVGSEGQLFSVTNNLSSGSIFSVNDISGSPSIDVDADGTIQLAPLLANEKVGIGTTNPQAKLDVNGSVNVAGIVTSNMIHLTGGTYRAGIDAITDSAIIVNEDFAIYCLETGGDYLRAIIEKDSNIISIGQPNTTTIQAIDLKPGFSGAVRLHHGTSGTNNVKLQTTGYGVSVTGLEVTGISTVQDLDVTGNNIFLDHGGSMSGVTTIGSYYYDKLVINSAVNSSVYADNPNWPAPAPHDMGWTGFEWRDGFFQGSVMSGELSRFDLTSAGIGSTHVNLTVQVATKSTDHRYHGQGSTSGYVIFEAGGSKSAIHSPFFTFTPGRKYRFDQSHNSNSTHQIKFYLEADRTTLYETGVTYNGTAGNAGAYTQIEITDTTPNVLHYQCVNHSYMGNSFQTNSNTSSKKFDSDITLSDDVKAIFGSTGAGDLQIFHGSTGNYINANVVRTTNTNTLLFEVANGSNGISFNHRTGNGNNDFENMITATPNAGVDLYFNGNKKIETTDSGSILTGLTTVTPSVEFTSSSYPSREFSLVFVDPSTNTQYAANVGVAKTLYHRYGGISFDDYSNTLSASGIEYFKTRNILVTTNNNNNRMHLRQGYGGSNSGGDASLGDTDNSSIALFESNGSAYITVASGIHTNIDAGVLFATSNGPTRGAILYNDQFQTLKFNTLSRSASNTRLSLSESGAVVSGVVTATSFKGPSGVTATFIGDGSGLTGITASGSGIVIKNSGSVVGTAGTIDFGANLSVSAVSSGIVTVTGSASGGGVTVQDEGSSLSTTATTLNFVGDGVVASGTGATKTITIPGGGSSAGGGLFSIEGERSGGVNLNNYYAVGNGAQPTQGQRIPVATSLKYMTLSNDGNSTMTVELYVNGSGSGKTISLSSSSAATADFTSSPLSIAAGDRVTFRCVAGSSTHTSVVAGWFHQNAVLPDSLVGTALSVSGISTIGNVLVGGGTTDLVVNGDARVTGILTVGTGSITIDPNEDKIQVGKVVLPNGNATTDTNAIAFAIALG